jgi:hypothetical protein
MMEAKGVKFEYVTKRAQSDIPQQEKQTVANLQYLKVMQCAVPYRKLDFPNQDRN